MLYPLNSSHFSINILGPKYKRVSFQRSSPISKRQHIRKHDIGFWSFIPRILWNVIAIKGRTRTQECFVIVITNWSSYQRVFWRCKTRESASSMGTAAMYGPRLTQTSPHPSTSPSENEMWRLERHLWPTQSLLPLPTSHYSMYTEVCCTRNIIIK